MRKGEKGISYLYRTEHYQMVLKAGDMEQCWKLAWHLRSHASASYPNFYVAQLAGKYCKVVLSGDEDLNSSQATRGDIIGQ